MVKPDLPEPRRIGLVGVVIIGKLGSEAWFGFGSWGGSGAGDGGISVEVLQTAQM